MKAGNNSSAKRIQKELAEISLDPPCNCSAGPKGDNIYEWVSTIMGPSGERGVATLMRAAEWSTNGVHPRNHVAHAAQSTAGCGLCCRPSLLLPTINRACSSECSRSCFEAYSAAHWSAAMPL